MYVHLCIHTFAYWVECSPIVRETRVQSQMESYQRLIKWFLMPPGLTFSIVRQGSSVKWSNRGNRSCCLPYWKRSVRVILNYGRQFYLHSYKYDFKTIQLILIFLFFCFVSVFSLLFTSRLSLSLYIYIYIYICECMWMPSLLLYVSTRIYVSTFIYTLAYVFQGHWMCILCVRMHLTQYIYVFET